jgi:CO/xanthine dehydrogenase Mo-binding subunit
MCAPSLGIGHALFERTACAEGSGQLLSGSDYALPRADDCPPADVTLADQPTTVNPSASRARAKPAESPRRRL